jgi:hypothetical protein
MLKRGKPSLQDLSVTPFTPDAVRVRPPQHLRATEAKLFREVVSHCPPSQFGPADQYLLSSFVRVTLIIDAATKDLAKSKPKDRAACMKALDQAIKSQCLLATKLRLTPLSRVDPKKLSRQHVAQRTGPPPWEV